MESVVFTIIIFILGVCIGSFLNVVIDRYPTGESIAKGRSYCDLCKKTLRWYDLIPVFSFLFYRGYSRCCQQKLSYYYPLVELVTGILFVFTYTQFLSFGYLTILFYLLIGISLLVIFFTDLKYGIIPFPVVVTSLIATLGYYVLNGIVVYPYLLSSLGAFLFFLIIFLATRGKGMGFGDVMYAALMGLVLGFPYIILGLYIAFLTGAVVSIILVLGRLKKLKGGSVPFGPFLVIGTALSLFWGDTLFTLFLQLLHIV